MLGTQRSPAREGAAMRSAEGPRGHMQAPGDRRVLRRAGRWRVLRNAWHPICPLPERARRCAHRRDSERQAALVACPFDAAGAGRRRGRDGGARGRGRGRGAAGGPPAEGGVVRVEGDASGGHHRRAHRREARRHEGARFGGRGSGYDGGAADGCAPHIHPRRRPEALAVHFPGSLELVQRRPLRRELRLKFRHLTILLVHQPLPLNVLVLHLSPLGQLVGQLLLQVADLALLLNHLSLHGPLALQILVGKRQLPLHVRHLPLLVGELPLHGHALRELLRDLLLHFQQLPLSLKDAALGSLAQRLLGQEALLDLGRQRTLLLLNLHQR
mmetsp:Transcript_24625/g.82443  ORF Transcript_24625/g.82443 Transcript_24625/m.82443 type:complete len:328 (-) Transcript_24625:855-1838(-)